MRKRMVINRYQCEKRLTEFINDACADSLAALTAHAFGVRCWPCETEPEHFIIEPIEGEYCGAFNDLEPEKGEQS